MFKMLSFRLYLMINKEDIQFVHELLDSPSYRHEAIFLDFVYFQKNFSMAVWNTIDDRYSDFVLYIETKPHFLIIASFESIFSMPGWNTIDDRYSIFVIYIVTKPHFLIFACF